jgi:hypothetical protein
MANQPRVHRVRWIVASAALILIAVVLWQKLAQKPPPRAAAAQIVRVDRLRFKLGEVASGLPWRRIRRPDSNG